MFYVKSEAAGELSRGFLYISNMEMNCTVNGVLFQNAENGYTVLNVTNEGTGKKEVIIANMGEVVCGMSFHMSGEYQSSQKYGMQFVASEWEEKSPTSLRGIEQYLASGLIRGVGPIFAKKIVQKFGTFTFDVLNNNPEELLTIPGLGQKKYESICEEWKKHTVIRDIMIFLKKYDIKTGLIFKIYRRYGDEAISIIKDNPYILADEIEGIGFKTADNIAINMGYDLESPERIACGVKYELNEWSNEGDVFAYTEDLIYESARLLEIDDEIVGESVESMISDGKLIEEDEKVYLPYLYQAEKRVADKILKMNSLAVFQPCSQMSIEDLEGKTGYKYEPEQKEAIMDAVKNRVMVLTGGPGTGKTTTTKGMIEMLLSMRYNIALAAPTGKAAKRISELTGREAKTIHRLLEFNPETGFCFNEYNYLPFDAVLVDEASMINVLLMDSLMQSINPEGKVVFIGDIDQLPCIGPGNVLKDMINSGVIPVVKLNRIFRQSQDSGIIMNAHRIKDGEDMVIRNKKDSDFFVIEDTEDTLGNTVDLVCERLPKAYGIKPQDIQVLTPMKKNNVGVININAELQKRLNPPSPLKKDMKHGGLVFREGDKVIQNENDYDKGVFNGESGTITMIIPELKIVCIDFDGRNVKYEFNEMDEVILAYAMTIHKSQGSEYPIVVIPITEANKIMMQRNLIYTAITRAKQVCVLIGSKRMMRLGIARIPVERRKTTLKERLQGKVAV